MFYFSGLIGSYIYGALLANFQPDVLNPLVLKCGFLQRKHIDLEWGAQRRRQVNQVMN